MFKRLSSCLLLFVCTLAHASVSPWVPFDRANDLRDIVSERIGTPLKLELIKSASSTIDIATYDERCDPEFTRPILTALRDAANRGVKVRMLVSWLGQRLFDKCGPDSSKRYLLETPTREPIQYVIFGGPHFAQPRGWSWFDSVHEKLVIVDGRMIVAGGRGWGASYLKFLDTDFLIKGALVPLIASQYQDVWDAALVQASPLKARRHTTAEPERFDSFPWTMTDTERAELDALVAFANAPGAQPPAAPTAEPAPGQPRARVLHYDFIAQLNAFGASRGLVHAITARLRKLHDPIMEEAAARLATAREARFNMLNGVVHPTLLKAMSAARRHGADVKVFLNVNLPEEAPMMPLAPTWIVSAWDVYTMLRNGIDVWGFKPFGDYNFIHRKMAIIDDTVFLGSHNFNAPSTVDNDELDVEIEDPALARDLATRLFDEPLRTNGFPLDPRKVAHEARWLKVLRHFMPHAIFRTM